MPQYDTHLHPSREENKEGALAVGVHGFCR
ncbi:hypothetical protein PMI16_02033, partial [Herbaspirillum sp. CF444]